MANDREKREKRFRLDLIAQELERAREGKSGGFEAVTYLRYVPILQETFRPRGAWANAAHHEVVTRALNKAASAPPITPAKLRKAVEEARAEYRAIRPTSYVLITQLTGKLARPREVHLPTARIGLSPTLGNRFARERRRLEGLLLARTAPRSPVGACWCTARVRARSPAEAFELAMGAVDLLRGIWCAGLRPGYRWSTTPSPLTPLLVGPMHSLHRPGGSAVSDTIWSHEPYPAFPKLVALDDRLRRFERAARQRLVRHPYRKKLEAALRRYARSLDDEGQAAAVPLWSLIEMLAGSSRQEPMVRRAAFIYRNPELRRAILEHLRELRNRLVHAGEGLYGEVSDMVLGEMSIIVHDLLLFHLREGSDFEDFDAACRFLDLPSNPQVLRKGLRFLRP